MITQGFLVHTYPPLVVDLFFVEVYRVCVGVDDDGRTALLCRDLVENLDDLRADALRARPVNTTITFTQNTCYLFLVIRSHGHHLEKKDSPIAYGKTNKCRQVEKLDYEP